MVYLNRDAGAVLVNDLAQLKKAPNVAVMFDPKLIRPIRTLGRNDNPVLPFFLYVPLFLLPIFQNCHRILSLV